MHLIYLTAFLMGLLIGVYAMWNGVERLPHRAGPDVDAFGRALATAHTSLRAPTAAAALTAFGAVGYLLGRYSTLGAGAGFAVAILASAAAIPCVVLLIARWIVPAAERDVVDERYLLQGHPAEVTRDIGTESAGLIAYDLSGTRHAAKARCIDAMPVPAGTEVIIERVEDGVIWVEPWVQVEQRI